MISIDRIAVRLRDRWLLNGLSWRINAGEQWLVVGPNGAGKTTLARAIAGLLPVVQGKIHYHSFDGIFPADAIAYVDSDTRRAFWQRERRLDHARAYAGRYDASTPVRDLLLRRRLPFQCTTAYRETPIVDAIRMFDIHHLLEKPAMAISTGEMSRVLVAREMVRNPKILILDEPFDGLDPESREQLKVMFQELAGTGFPMIFITHHEDEILDTTTHRLVIDDGRVVHAGPIDRITSQTKLPSKIASDQKSRPTPTLGSVPHPSARGPSPEPLIDMAAVTVRYGDTVVLDHLSWKVNPGEHWAVTGPNGAGKTTLLKLITGDCLQVFANRVRLLGQNRGPHQTLWEIRRHLGVVSHDLAIGYQKSLTALEVVCSGFFDSVGLYRYCDDRQVKTAKGWLAKLDAAGLSSTLFDRLSRGQRQAVLIARAMVKSPRLLLLDEPCAGLDDKTRKIVLRLVEKIGREEKTSLIYISHRRAEIPFCTTHHLALDRGRVVACGPVGADSG